MDSQQLKYIPKETRIAWEVLPQLETQLTEQFVEANPNVPENPPDKSKQFSFRDQQAAQPEITKASLLQSAPVILGNEKSQKIIQGKK